MKARESKWPYRPGHITNDGEKCGGDLSNLTGLGIIANDYLQGIQKYISATLERPTTIAEFGVNKKFVRNDSNLLMFPLFEVCKYFRDCTNDKFCKQCYENCALLLHQIEKEDFKKEVLKRKAESKFFKENFEEGEIHFERQTYNGQPYLEYDCPCLGYRELLFPIFFEGKVIASFFVGEHALSGHHEETSQIRRRFFQQRWGEFKTECERSRKCKEEKINAETVKNTIEQKHDYIIENEDKEISEAEYQGIIQLACKGIERLEKTLNEQMEIQRENYVRGKVNEIVTEFREDFSKEHKKSEDAILLFRETVKKCLEKMIRDFYLDYIIVFSSEQEETQGEAKTGPLVLDKFIEAFSEPGTYKKEDEIHIDITSLLPELRGQHISSAERPEFLGCVKNFPVELKEERNLVRLFPLPLENKMMAVLIGYYPQNSLKEIENWPGGVLGRNFQVFYSVVLSSFAALLAQRAKRHLNQFLKMIGHESKQLTFGLQTHTRRFLSDPYRLQNVTEEQAKNFTRNIMGYSNQLRYLFDRVRMLVSEPPKPEKKLFRPFKKLIYKWGNIYRFNFEYKKVEFSYHLAQSTDELRPDLYGDPILLEQLLYSFVNNAVKYCYRGTRIFIDAKKPTPKANEYIFTVMNYGRKFDCTEPFKLESRGNNVAGIEGMGIGLYLAKRIADAHNGTIEVDSNEVCKYNVPCLRFYKDLPDEKKNPVIDNEVTKELNRLKQNGFYDEIIGKGRHGLWLYNPGDNEVLNYIELPTYRVILTISLPT